MLFFIYNIIIKYLKHVLKKLFYLFLEKKKE